MPNPSPLDTAEELAKFFVERHPPGTDVPAGAFAAGPEPLPGETTDQLRKSVLRTLGVIDVSPGRGGPARTAAKPLEDAKRVLAAARAISMGLGTSGRVGLDEIRRLSTEEGVEADRPSALLKQLGIAIGVQRAGGLRRADVAQQEANEALQKSAALPDLDEKVPPNNQRESTYYEFIATLLDSWDSYEATVVGGAQIGRGEWSTPDVVAVSVEQAPSLIVPIVRVATVEVKLELTRVAIAEACSHKRFAHYAYVGVPQAPGDMETALLTELSCAGLGLICPRQRGSLTFHVYLEPPLNRPDEEDIEQLLQRFRDTEGHSISLRTRDRVRKSLGVLFQS